MLIKLLKHEIQAMGRILMPLMLALIITSAALGINVRTLYGAPEITTLTVVLIVVLCIMLFLVFMLTFILVIQRFRHSFLGNEGYLTFALPASTAEHLLSKYLSSILYALLTAAIALLSFWIITFLGIPTLERRLGTEVIRRFMDEFGRNGQLGPGFLMSFISMTELIAHLYASISIGHLWSGHPVFGAILAYVGTSILRNQIFIRLMGGLIIDYSFNSFSTPYITFCLVFSVLYSLLTWFILDKKLNLE